MTDVSTTSRGRWVVQPVALAGWVRAARTLATRWAMGTTGWAMGRSKRVIGMPRWTIGSSKRLMGAGVFAAAMALAPHVASAQSGGVSLALGTQAPDAEVQTLDGDAVSLLDHVEEGKPALIEFWASWCEQCEALQPQLDEIQTRFGDRMSVVAVAVGVAQSPRRVRRHLEDHDPGYPFLYDSRGNAVRAYNAATTSIIVMLDGEGKVAYTGVGTEQDLLGAVEGLIGG